VHVPGNQSNQTTISPDLIITFPNGMLGFEYLKHYRLVQVPENPFFYHLQAVDEPAVGFLLVDPFVFFQGYEVELKDIHLKNIGITEQAEPHPSSGVLVLAVVTIPPEGVAGMTANLLGPVAINLVAAKGAQVVLEGTAYTTKHRLFSREPENNPRAAAR